MNYNLYKKNYIFIHNNYHKEFETEIKKINKINIPQYIKDQSNIYSFTLNYGYFFETFRNETFIIKLNRYKNVVASIDHNILPIDFRSNDKTYVIDIE